MKAIVVYDSRSRTCRRVAEEIAEVLGDASVAASEVDVMDVEASELVVVGGSARRHGLSPQLEAFFDRLPAEGLRGLQAAAFETKVVGSHLLAMSPAVGISRALQQRGARLAERPESFFVSGPELSLQEGELERARAWAVELLETARELVEQRASGAEAPFAGSGVLRQAGAHHFPATPITIRWSGTKVPEPDEEEDGHAGRH